MFGGFASSAWKSSNYNYINDSDEFLFSVRRNGVSIKENFTVKNAAHALFGIPSYEPTFGSSHDIYICNQSNLNIGSGSYFGHSYNLPNGYTCGGNAKDFLAGNYEKWTYLCADYF